MMSKIIQIGRSGHDLEHPRSLERNVLPVNKRKRGDGGPDSAAVRTSAGGTIDGECVLVPEGEYELRYVYYETMTCFRTPRVIVHYAIAGSDEYAGLPVERFYSVKELTGPAKRFGNYKATPRTDLVREYRRITGPIRRHDRLSFAPFKGMRIVGQIVTVTTDHKQRELTKDDYYSKIDRLVTVLPAE